MPRDNITEISKATQFKPGNPGGGRPKNVFKQFKNKFELSKTDVGNLINFVASKNIKQLKEMMMDGKNPALLSAFISMMINAIKKGDMRTLEIMLNYAIGKVEDKKQVDANITIHFDKEDENL